MHPPATSRRRALLRRLRRVGTLVSTALIVIALLLFFTTSVSEKVSRAGTQELINGQAGTGSLLLPLGLFVLGIVGLAICLK
jgi:hypothetical protein